MCSGQRPRSIAWATSRFRLNGLTEFSDRNLFDGIKSFQRRRGLKIDGVMKPGGETERAIRDDLPKAGGFVAITRPDARTVDNPVPTRGRDLTSTTMFEDRFDLVPKPKPGPTTLFEQALDGEPRPSVRPIARPTVKQKALPKLDLTRVFGVDGHVGPGRGNAGRNVLAARRALAWAGLMPRREDHDRNDAAEDLFAAIRGFQKHRGLAMDGWMRPGGPTEAALEKAVAPKVAAWREGVRFRAMEKRAEDPMPPTRTKEFDPERGDKAPEFQLLSAGADGGVAGPSDRPGTDGKKAHEASQARKPGEDRQDFLARIGNVFGNPKSSTPEGRATALAALEADLAKDPASRDALIQGVRLDAHESAARASDNVQQAYDDYQKDTPGAPRTELPTGGVLDAKYFVGPDGQIYEKTKSHLDPLGTADILALGRQTVRHDQFNSWNQAVCDKAATSTLRESPDVALSEGGVGARLGPRKQVGRQIPQDDRLPVEKSAERANQDFAKGFRARSADAAPHPPYELTEPVHTKTLKRPSVDEFVRVVLKRHKDSPAGKWLMRKPDFEKIMKHPDGPRRLKDAFALPEVPDHVVDVKLPKGTKIGVGTANGHPEWGRGGGTQIEVKGKFDDDWFVNSRIIRDKKE